MNTACKIYANQKSSYELPQAKYANAYFACGDYCIR